MTDRMDIDALLIGALYGELTPADEARLTAHLESHPADRTALADLTRTREQLRESRALAFQAEPPQAVSALLLQEAARRAPRPQRESEGWFQRLARSLMAHPALATAATLVVVVSVAGSLYLRHGEKLAETSAHEVASETTAAPAGAAAQAPAATPTTAAESPPPPPRPADTVAQGTRGAAGPRDESGAAGGAAAGSGAYGVGLTDTRPERTTERARSADKANGKGDGAVALDLAKEAQSDQEADKAPGATKPSPSKAELKTQKKAAGIEVLTPEPAPKELETTRRAGAKLDVADRRADEPIAQAHAQADDLAPPAAAPAPVPQAPPPPPSPKGESAPQKPQTTPPAAADPSAGLRSKAGNANTSNGGGASNAPAAGNAGRIDGNKLSNNAPARKAAPNAASPSTSPRPPAAPRQQVDGLFAEGQDADGKDRASDTTWARNKHEQVIALVKSKDCRAAANAAMEIYGRAPSYYANNVATDRSVKPCFAYLDGERRKEDRVRAAKRANAANATNALDAGPSQAPPAQAQPPPQQQQAAPPVRK